MRAKELFDIAGKKAIVTGASRGLGHGMAEILLDAGCEVAIVGSSDIIFKVAEEFTKKGYKCHGVKGDLSDRAQVNKIFEDSMTALNNDVDILVTAAGVQRRHLAEEFPLEDWDTVINVNLTSVFMLCQLASRVMLKKGYGKIINVSSLMAFFGGQTIAAYTASKGAVTQLTKALSNDLYGRGICVNAIAPGYMDTDMNVALINNEERNKQITARIPAGRWGTEKDMQGATIFLASKASDYVSGVTLPVDGGYLAK